MNKILDSSQPKTPILSVSMVIALAITGDSLMYSLLPLQADQLGITLAGVGMLLSANRIIRLFSNTWAGLAFERWGARKPFVFAAVLSVITTALYGAGFGFAVFLLARIGWGIAWSLFRHAGYVAVWAGSRSSRGRLMGTLWGVVRVGSAVSVLLGGYLFDRFNFATAVLAIAIITLLAIPASLRIRWSPVKDQEMNRPTSSFAGWREGLQTASRRWIIAVSFAYTLLEAIVAITLSKYIELNLGGTLIMSAIGIGTIAGIMLALRFTADFFFAPLLGAISDRFGYAPMIALLATLILTFMLAAAYSSGIWPLLFITLVFFAGSGMFATVNAAGSSLAMDTTRPHLFVSLFTTAIDAGAALGPLIAFPLVGWLGFGNVYMIAAGMLTLVASRFWYISRDDLGASSKSDTIYIEDEIGAKELP
ncbi:MAG: MFS transporter [Chloroflexi bacterium]|nr:MFS transporter [Chloroflexota bacterium]